MNRASIARWWSRLPIIEWLAPFGLLTAVALLSFTLPMSIWATNDYPLDSLSGAINLAYRLSDLTLYPAPSMGNHPGVPQYLVSWLSLALSGFPIATSDIPFFEDVLDNAERFRWIAIILFTFCGAAGLYAIAVAIRGRVPPLLVPALCLLWFVSTPAVPISFIQLSIDAFGLLLTAWMVSVLLGIARAPRIASITVASAGALAAAGYLTKLSYICFFVGICAALAAAIAASHERRHNITMAALFLACVVLAVLSAAFWIIEWSTFASLLEFHRGVIFHAGPYGTGDEELIAAKGLLQSLINSFHDAAWSIVLALAGSAVAGLWGAVLLFDPKARSSAIFAIGAAATSGFSALSTLKHYALPYSAGTATTLPLLGLSLFLLAQNRGITARWFLAGIVALAALMTIPTTVNVVESLHQSARRSQDAAADRIQLDELVARRGCLLMFAYHVPFRELGAAFLLKTSGVPRLVFAYLAEQREKVGSPLQDFLPREPCALVIDRKYFRTADVSFAPGLLTGAEVTPGTSDVVSALKTVFVLSPHAGSRR